MLSVAQGHFKGQTSWFAVAGACLGVAVLCRPAAVAWPLCVGAHLLWSRQWSRLLSFIVAGLPMAVFFAWYNVRHFGSIVTTGQTIASVTISKYKGADGLWSSHLLVGLSTLVLSPARGLLFHSPWLLVGGVVGFSSKASGRIEWVKPFVMAVVLQVFLAAKFFDHWVRFTDGHTY